MSIRRFAANYVFPVDAPPLKNGIVEVDKQGRIHAVYAASNPDALHSTEFHNGAIVPGFVNAHCHLELSHMRGRIPNGLGLIEFVRRIGQQRQASAEQIAQAIDDALSEMRQTGTVAVADICNTTHTLQAKQQSDIAFRNLVEVFGIHADEAQKAYTNALSTHKAFATQYADTAIVPHAPYSMSDRLWQLLQPHLHSLTSIHLGECQAEYELLEHSRGDLYNRYSRAYSSYSTPAGGSPEGVVERNMPANCTPLLVHCTYAQPQRLKALSQHFTQATVVTCPESNLYLEDRLPNLPEWQRLGLRIAIGTDSLASCTTLSMLHNINLILSAFPTLQFADVLRWATLNSAEALGLDNKLGSLSIGKRPGLCLIDHFDFVRMRPSAASRVRRLV